ncbi:MAG: transketolase [Candidatus Pacebacteria bacterium]|nr:transketolase [Candidatus Paceibacterota bacterium]
MNLSKEKIEELKNISREIRKSIIRMLFEAGSGHTAGPLGMADIFTSLYFGNLSHNPQNPNWEERDRLILSNGHICPVLYASMAHSGYFPIQELQTLRKKGTRLQGHPHREFLPYLETSSGPLGEGLSQAVGMAIAEKINKSNSSKKFYCLMSDGEMNEGQTWEAAMLGAKHKLNNLIAIVDRNNIQISGFTEEIMPLNNLIHKWSTFNWNVLEIDGNDFNEINNALEKTKESKDRPSMIIAKTTPGNGVKLFENNYHWHGSVPNKEQAKQALLELDENI